MKAPKDLTQFAALVEVVAKLRSPQGCPWDRKQSHASMRECLLEECYEVLDTLDKGDTGKLCEELGDLLMQVVMHVQIATEEGEFQMGDVVEGISSKLIRRHPHVFGSVEVKDADEVLLNWEELKKKERENEQEGEKSMLDNIPKALPSLAYSQEIQSRAARVGFDWEEDSGVIDKLAEEVDEFRRAGSPKEREDEFGDMLFTLANIARRMDIDLESALRNASGKFFRRFNHMEKLCRERGRSFAELSFDEQNALWEQAKGADR